MANARTELCGACCKGSHPIRKRFLGSIVCTCGAPFFSQIVEEDNLPINQRCLIKIPMNFMEDHGSRLDKIVTLQEKEDSEIHPVKIEGNVWTGFGLEWRDFAQTHHIAIGQVVVFTLVERSWFVVQVYKADNPSSIPAIPQTSARVEAEQAGTVPPPFTLKVESDDDDIEVCVAQDWLVAKARRTNTANPILPSKVKVEKVFSETSSGQAVRTPDIDGNERQKRRIVPNDLEGMDVSDGIVEASDSSRQKKKLDSESFHEGHSLRGTTRRALRYEHPVLKIPAEDQGGLGGQASPQASTRESSSDSEEIGDSDASSASTSDSAWSPGKSHSDRGRKRSAANSAAYSDSNTEDEDEDEEDGEDGVEDDQVLSKIARKKRSSADGSSSLDEDEEDGEDGVEDDQVMSKIAGKKRSSADGSSSLDEVKRKRGRSSMRIKTETGLASADDERNETRNGLLVEGCNSKRNRHGWHEPGTKRGRTYVSKRRSVTESEKVKTLAKAEKVQVQYPSFPKQLRKGSCYGCLILSAPTSFYRKNMISATKGSYKATLMDEEGKSWPTHISGMKIFWKHFTLDHYLEEDDVVVFELVDPRPESVTFLVHIFRVVDVKVTLTGKAGWAVHYDVVEGTKKQYFEERRRLAQAQKQKQKQKQKQRQNKKHKLKDESSNPEIDTEFTEFFWEKSKQPSVITEVYKRAFPSQGKSRGLPNEKHASDSPNADQHDRSPWRRPTTVTTRNKSREINQSSSELNYTTPNKSVGSVKQEMEDAPPLAIAGTFTGNASNSVNTEPSVLELLEEVFGREDSDWVPVKVSGKIKPFVDIKGDKHAPL